MNELRDKEVYFYNYCSHCKHKDVKETHDPCNECLTQSWNEGTHKPIKFEEAE